MKLLVALIVFAHATPAFASEPQFGRWAVDPQHCASDTKAGPLVVTPTSASLASETCTFGKMYKADRALYIEGRCSGSAGLMIKHPITLAMKGERLAVTWNGEHTEMKRCP